MTVPAPRLDLAARPSGERVLVRNLEALDGTPILDVKPVLGDVHER
jgi:tRNA (Thr-GGU) A37 N-methylase